MISTLKEIYLKGTLCHERLRLDQLSLLLPFSIHNQNNAVLNALRKNSKHFRYRLFLFVSQTVHKRTCLSLIASSIAIAAHFASVKANDTLQTHRSPSPYTCPQAPNQTFSPPLFRIRQCQSKRKHRATTSTNSPQWTTSTCSPAHDPGLPNPAHPN